MGEVVQIVPIARGVVLDGEPSFEVSFDLGKTWREPKRGENKIAGWWKDGAIVAVDPRIRPAIYAFPEL